MCVFFFSIFSKKNGKHNINEHNGQIRINIWRDLMINMEKSVIIVSNFITHTIRNWKFRTKKLKMESENWDIRCFFLVLFCFEHSRLFDIEIRTALRLHKTNNNGNSSINQSFGGLGNYKWRIFQLIPHIILINICCYLPIKINLNCYVCMWTLKIHRHNTFKYRSRTVNIYANKIALSNNFSPYFFFTDSINK